MSRPRASRESLREAMRLHANWLEDSANEVRTMALYGGCDDPMHPWKVLQAPFHSWIEFVDQVCRPLLAAEEACDEVEIQRCMALYRMTNPHIATCLVMAANRAGVDDE